VRLSKNSDQLEEGERLNETISRSRRIDVPAMVVRAVFFLLGERRALSPKSSAPGPRASMGRAQPYLSWRCFTTCTFALASLAPAFVTGSYKMGRIPSLTTFIVFTALISLLASLVAAASDQFPATVTIYAWPLSAPSPTSFATVSIDSHSTAKIESVTFPAADRDEIVRVGLYDPQSKRWTGVAASSSAFAEDVRKKLTLHLDEDGQVFHVGYGAAPRKEDVSVKKPKKPKKEKPKSKKALEREERERQRELKRKAKSRKAGKGKKGEPPEEEEEKFVVEVVPQQDGPKPILNKPIVVNAEGRVEGAPEADTKTFLQK
jgi:hypothetical protein